VPSAVRRSRSSPWRPGAESEANGGPPGRRLGEGLGHLCFVIGAQSIVARQSAPAEQDRNFGHFTIGASLGQLVGPIAAGAVIGGDMARTSALALVVSAVVAAVSFTSLWRIEGRTDAPAVRDREPKVPVHRILRARGVPAGIFISLSVLSATDILTAYLPVIGEHRGIAPATVGLLLSLRAAATIACRLVMTPMIRLLGRTALMTVTCLLGGLLCAGIALPVPVWALALMLAVLGFCLGVGQPLSMTTVVQAAPADARSTALALRLTGNRLGQVAAPASAGLVAGVAGTAAPFAMLGVLLLAAAGLATRQPGRRDHPGVDGPRAGGLPRPPGADGSVQKAQPQPARESFPDRE
jgi:MFS family permease